MSVWQGGFAPGSSLNGSEGALIAVSLSVEPRYLEDLLDALAQLDFPINPQIFHDAAVRYLYADGHEVVQPTTLVEFPAYEARLPQISKILADHGLAADSLHAAGMLDEIHAEPQPEPAPPGASYVSRVRIKHAHAGAI